METDPSTIMEELEKLSEISKEFKTGFAGSVNFEQFKDYASMKLIIPSTQKHSDYFFDEIMDPSGEGFITPRELFALAKKSGIKTDENECKRMIAITDETVRRPDGISRLRFWELLKEMKDE